MKRKIVECIFIVMLIMVTVFLSACDRKQLIPNGTYTGVSIKGTEECLVVTRKGIVFDKFAWEEYIDIFGSLYASGYRRKTGSDISTEDFIAELKANFDHVGYERFIVPHDQVQELSEPSIPWIYYEFPVKIVFLNGREMELWIDFCPKEGCFGIYEEDYATGEIRFRTRYRRVDDQ